MCKLDFMTSDDSDDSLYANMPEPSIEELKELVVWLQGVIDEKEEELRSLKGEAFDNPDDFDWPLR